MCSSYETQEELSTNSHLLRSQFTVHKLNSLHVTLAESIQMDGEPQIELFATHQTVIEGSTVDLVCSFQVYCPSDVTWWMSEGVAGDTQTAPNGTLLSSGHVLRLSALLVGDSSRYCCHSNNTSGATVQACIELEVLSSGKDYYSVPIFDCTVYKTSHMIWRQVHCAKYYHLVCTVLTTPYKFLWAYGK